MNFDPIETMRRLKGMEINTAAVKRWKLEEKYGQVWDTVQPAEDFEVLAFMAPVVMVRRRSDRMIGSLLFQHDPRFYFEFEPHNEVTE